MSCLDRLRAQTSAGERAPARRHTGGSRARAGAAACPGRTRGIARRRAGLHHRGGARAARRARAGRAPNGGDRAARREYRGLARCARPRRALASGRRRPGPSRVRVRGGPALRGRLPEPGGTRVARRRGSLVPARGVGSWPIHRRALRRRARAHRFGVRAGRARALEPLHPPAGARGLVPYSRAVCRVRRCSTLCAGARRGGTDPSARCRVAVVARAGDRGGRARRCGG